MTDNRTIGLVAVSEVTVKFNYLLIEINNQLIVNFLKVN